MTIGVVFVAEEASGKITQTFQEHKRYCMHTPILFLSLEDKRKVEILSILFTSLEHKKVNESSPFYS